MDGVNKIAIEDGVEELPPDTPKTETKLKLHLACGSEKREGFVNVDMRETKATDRVVDLQKMPWPWETDSIEEIECKDYLPCLTPQKRIAFMEEAWRVLKPGGKMILAVPGRGSNRSLADPTFVWPPIVEDYFYWFSKEWREAQGHSHYPIKSNFHWGYGFGLDDEWTARNEEAQRFALKFYRNVAHSLIVTLTKLP